MRITVHRLLLLSIFFVSTLQAQFSAGNLAVFRADNATANNTSFSILELNNATPNQSSPVNTIAINGVSGADALRTSGSAGTTGFMANSNDGSLLCFTAHNTSTTSSNANTFTARAVGTLNAAGNFSLAATYTGTSGNQTRCATTINNASWFIADQGGVYTNSASTASPAGNYRSVRSFGGTVYIFQANTSNAPVGILSAASGGTVTGLPGLANGAGSYTDFYMVSSGTNGTAFDILYLLSTANASSGTILKYSLVGGTWVANGTHATSFGGFGMAASTGGTGAFIYITTGVGSTAANSVIRLADDAGYNTSISVNTTNNITLYTAAAGTTLKGIAFAPVATALPTVGATPASFNFGTVNTGASSASQTISLTASNLTAAAGVLTVSSPNTSFEIYNGTTWTNTATLNYSSNGAAIDNFQARFTPQSAGLLTANITVDGGGLASPLVIGFSGTGNNSNNLSFAFNTATTAAINPPYVSGTVNDAADPAAVDGIVTTVQENAIAIPLADYSIAVASSNTTVVPLANITVTKSDGSTLVKILPAAAGYSTITLTLTKGAGTKDLVINYAASVAPGAAANWLTGIADASAAIALDNDYMVIANDESNLLYVYKRNAPGLPVKTFDFNTGNALALTDGSTGNWKEADVEAAVTSPTVAGKSYWLGSMSNSSSFNDKPNRNRVFAINTSGTGAGATFSHAGYYAGLRQQLITWGDANGYAFSASAADGKDPKLIDGFNAEGMVFAPNNTTLYIGFRAPLVPTAARTKAVIAPVQNFETWFNNGAPSGNASIGTPIELDLGGRGIRDMVRLADGKYIIVAGSYDETPVPAIYRWNGNPASAVVLLNSYNLTGLNAEAAIAINENGQSAGDKIQIISDNGDHVYYNDGAAAKDLAQDNYKKFITQVITSATQSLLPVRFEYFTAQRNTTSVQLAWKTGLQDDAGWFEIMRSEDGAAFSKIKTVQALPGQSSYTFTDAGAPVSRLYYRIHAKDLSGQLFLSTIRSIEGNGLQEQVVKIYPNPVGNGLFTLTVNKPGVKTVHIYNNAGILYKQVSFSNMSKDVSTEGWAKGYYILRITTNDGAIRTEKLVIQ